MNTINEIKNWKGNVGRFLAAQTVSLFGSSLVQYAIVWYITLTTSSGAMLTISTLCGFLPQIAVSLFAGVLIDRYDRKKLIMCADALIALSTLALALAFLAGERKIAFLFAALVVRSLGTGVQTPAVNSILPQLVPSGSLMRVNGINSTLSSVMMFLSPAASGALLSFAPLETVLFIDVATAAVGIGITLTVTVRPFEKREASSGSHLKELADGFAYIRKNAFIGRLIVFQLAVLFLISPSAFLTPLMVSRTFGAEVWRLTASEMTYSLGMVCGGLLISLWGGFKKRLDTTLLAGGVYGAVMIGLGAAPLFWVYLILNSLIGITSPCYNAPITVTIQERADPAMHGRIFSLMQIASSCALPLGMAFFGPLADLVRVQHLLVSSGIAVMLLAGSAAFFRVFDR